ncbi:serine/threonine-protein kinase ctr1 [Plakobranchus ocellatus]|uniref:Serine/threonine-protein kinase ctr1 n=1 Tax=Plakobranchus ocellatus TaxID=259542 RepID=A0AAV4BKN4_9GAST|nr:serine/threonine-protein kinase ctr1 [Plakobranchus ocellatus]
MVEDELEKGCRDGLVQMPRTYVDNAANRRLGRVGMSVGSAVQSSRKASVPRTYVDNRTNRELGRAGLPVGSAVHSNGTSSQRPSSTSSSSRRTYVDNRTNRELGRVGLPVGTAVHSPGASSQRPVSMSGHGRTYVDNRTNRELGRVGLPVGAAVHSKGNSSHRPSSTGSSAKTYVDNPMNRELGRVGLPVGTAVHSKAASRPPSSSACSSARTYVDNPMNRELGRVGLPVGTAVLSKAASTPSSSSSSPTPKTYVDNPMNRELGRVGLPVGTAAHSKAASRPSSSSDSPTPKTYVDNPMNRELGRVGLPIGTAVHSKAASRPSSNSDSPTPKTYVDNPMNRKLGRVGLPIGTAVHSKAVSRPSSSSDSSSPRTYVDNPMNRELGRVGQPVGTAVHSKAASRPSSSSARKVYKDNDFNRKHNRVGLPLGSKPVRKTSGLVYQDCALNRHLGRVGLPLGSRTQYRKKLPTIRRYLMPAECGYDDKISEKETYSEDDSRFEEAILRSFYDDNDQEIDEQFDNDCNHVMEALNKIRQEDLWVESEGRSIRSSAKITDPLYESLLLQENIKFEDLDIKDKIGHGGFGDVYFAVYKPNSVVVAVKILKQTCLTPKHLELFQTEITNHRQLNHPNIVKLYGPCFDRDVTAFIMEYMRTSLYESIHIFEDDLQLHHKLKILKDITSGLAYLHSLPCIHGDLKTQNVLLNNVPGWHEYDNNQPVIAKLTDFGFSLLTSNTHSSLLKKNVPVGTTLQFAPPEVMRHQSLNYLEFCKVDIYTMGMLIMELVVEEIPFDGLSNDELIHLVGDLGTKPAPPPGLVLDRTLEDMLHTCWSFDPDERPDAEDLVAIVHSISALLV